MGWVVSIGNYIVFDATFPMEVFVDGFWLVGFGSL